MSDEFQPFKKGDRVVMVASITDEGDPPNGTIGTVIETWCTGVPRIEWDDWTNCDSTRDWFVGCDQIQRCA